ncbi:YSIRK-type signal peptide-containing protein [Staphylococcus sp. EZ-P03]|uniref:YSIRK-type signal peptide-containing protein n=1 Tax=Staphylococcus sp. EZ-P03 TaxID=2282739 RepID=UPI0013C46805|nr:YSIRK-type signal peptide-containing protein [Staphylococcus sp. EZ-P03]
MKKKQLFSLRKLSVGIASVSLGTALVFGGSSAQAETQSSPAQAAYQKVDALQHLTPQEKANFKKRIEQSAQTQQPPVEAVLNDAVQADQANANQAAVKKQVQTAQNVAKEQVEKAQAEVNKLANISKENKAIYNAKIAKAGVAEIPGIVKDAKAVDAQVQLAKNAAKEQEQKQKAAGQTQRSIDALKNLSAKEKAGFHKQVLRNVEVGQSTEPVLKDAKQLDAINGATAKIAALHNLTDQQKNGFYNQVKRNAQVGAAVESVVKDATQLDKINSEEKNVKENHSQDAPKTTKDLAQHAFDTISGLTNLTDQQKGAFNKQINSDISNNNSANLENILNNARVLNAKNAKDKNVKEDHSQDAPKTTQDLAQHAFDTISGLTNLTDQQKGAFNKQINSDIANNNSANLENILNNARVLNAKNAKDKNVKEDHSQDAPKTTKDLAQYAFDTISGLNDLTDQQKGAFNKQINSDIANNNSANLENILNNARVLNAKNAKDKNVKENHSQDAPKTTQDLAQYAFDTISGLTNLTDQQKGAFNKQINSDIANNNSANLENILNNARVLNAKNAKDKNVKEAGSSQALSKAVLDKANAAHKAVAALKNLTPAEKAAFQTEIAEAAHQGKDLQAIVKAAKDADALKAKVVKKDDKKATTTTPAKTTNKVDNSGKTTGNTTGKDQVTKDGKKAPAQGVKAPQKAADQKAAPKAAAAQKAKDAKKQLPATGEQDQVLFGLLSGSVIASAGTLFLLNARRRKENE